MYLVVLIFALALNIKVCTCGGCILVEGSRNKHINI